MTREGLISARIQHVQYVVCFFFSRWVFQNTVHSPVNLFLKIIIMSKDLYKLLIGKLSMNLNTRWCWQTRLRSSSRFNYVGSKQASARKIICIYFGTIISTIHRDGEKTEDAPAILVYLNIRALNPSANVFVEYIHTENTKLMKAFAVGRDLQAFNTPAFMSGSVFTVSMLGKYTVLVFDETYLKPSLNGTQFLFARLDHLPVILSTTSRYYSPTSTLWCTSPSTSFGNNLPRTVTFTRFPITSASSFYWSWI